MKCYHFGDFIIIHFCHLNKYFNLKVCLEAKQSIAKVNPVFHHLLSVGPKQLFELVHLDCTRERVLRNIYNVHTNFSTHFVDRLFFPWSKEKSGNEIRKKSCRSKVNLEIVNFMFLLRVKVSKAKEDLSFNPILYGLFFIR